MQVDLVLPQESWELIRKALLNPVKALEFCRVSMTLPQILDGAFFTEYIKIGTLRGVSLVLASLSDWLWLRGRFYWEKDNLKSITDHAYR